MASMKNFVILGGGTGSSTVARGLKNSTNVTGVLTTCDDGGSSGLIIDGMRVGPVGDLRQLLLALTDSQTETDLSWRFAHQPFNGHPLGNVILAGLIAQRGTEQGIKRFCEIHGIKNGTAIPMTAGPLQLCLRRPDGGTIVGESELGENCEKKKYFPAGITPMLSLLPIEEAILSEDAEQAIRKANAIIIGPGKWYSSVAPLMLVKGMREVLTACAKRGTPIMCVVNIMEHAGQTDGLSASEHVRVLEELLGERIFTHVIVNDERPSDLMLERYTKENENPVRIDPENLTGQHYIVVCADVLSRETREQNPADLLVRTVVRHDSGNLGDLLMEQYLRWKREWVEKFPHLI